MRIYNQQNKQARHANITISRSSIFPRALLAIIVTYCFSNITLANYADQPQNNLHQTTNSDLTWLPPNLSNESEPPLTLAISPLNVTRRDLLFSKYTADTNALTLQSSQGNRLEVFALTAEEESEVVASIDRGMLSKTHYGAMLDVVLGEPIDLQFGYIGEQKDHVNTISASPMNRSDANSWNMAINTDWLNNSIKTRWEYAQSSKFEETLYSSQPLHQKHSGNALRAQLKLSSEGDFGSGWLDAWNGHVEYRKVDQHYYTPANSKIDAGKEFTRIAFESAVSGIKMRIAWNEEQEVDSLRRLTLSPQTEKTSIKFKYDLSPIVSEHPLLTYLEAPILSARYSRTGARSHKNQLYLRGRTDNQYADESGVNLAFSVDQWQWSFDYQIIEKHTQSITYEMQSIDTIFTEKNHQRRSEVQLSWIPLDTLQLKMKAQKRYQSGAYSLSDKLQHIYQLEAAMEMIPNVISLQVKYDYQQEERSQLNHLDSNYISHQGNAKLSWHSIEELGHRPSLDFYLKSSYGYKQGNIHSENNQNWSAHLGLELSWAK